MRANAAAALCCLLTSAFAAAEPRGDANAPRGDTRAEARGDANAPRGDVNAPRGDAGAEARGAGAARSDSARAAPGVGVEVRGSTLGTQRGIGDTRVTRDLLEASPRQHASELLSAAPGFFVDHEDAEGLGNDVYLRGFDLEHGSGIEMKLGPLPINIPTHVRGQGYADVDFIIPEVVESVRVLEGCYDPRQNDSAIVGSAYFQLGVPERGTQLKASYGSFGQRRVLAIAAPRGLRNDTFVAVAARKTDGFGQRRAGDSISMNSSVGVELDQLTQLRVLSTVHMANRALPGVVREDDVDAGRIGFYDSYRYFAENQSVRSRRATVSLELVRRAPRGARFVLAPWLMWTNLRVRQNYTGALETSQQDPSLSGIGDLFQTANAETAAGLSSSYRDAVRRLGSNVELVIEPGTFIRFGRSQQDKRLLEPSTLTTWDRRLAAALSTLDAAAYLDIDLRFWRRLRLVGGVRADLLAVQINDALGAPSEAHAPTHTPANAVRDSHRTAAGVALSPRATLELSAAPGLLLSSSYGEGFRSLDAAHLPDGNTAPYSKVRSVELGLRARDAAEKYTASLALFRTWVQNELVFTAEEGGLETQNASIRSGVVSSLLARPTNWLLASAALTISSARYRTLAQGISHHVPSVPPILFRSDLATRGVLTQFLDAPLNARVGVGYSFLSGRHLTDTVIGPATHALNLSAGLRRTWLELSLDVYNALAARYADSADRYISNWSRSPGQQPASLATHFVASPPTTLLASLTLYL
ncbi:MAG: TonB-dependent receptor [Myxococcota bacterium]